MTIWPTLAMPHTHASSSPKSRNRYGSPQFFWRFPDLPVRNPLVE